MNLTWHYTGGMLTEYFSYSSQVVGNSCCCLIVHNADGLNGMCFIFCYFRGQNIKISSLTPLTFNNINIELQALLLINPEQTELANQKRDNSITRRQCVCECTFPCTSPCPKKTSSISKLRVITRWSTEKEWSTINQITECVFITPWIRNLFV